MEFLKFLTVAAVTACTVMPTVADTVVAENGGDTFAAGNTVVQTLNADGDVFVAGQSSTVLGRSAGDLHVSGFDVFLDADVAEDAYAAGATVTLQSDIGQDLSAAGFTVRLEPGGRVGENARLMGSTLLIEAPIAGALTATAREIYLNAPVSGDVRLLVETLRFGPDARIDGQLTYSSEEELSIPEGVIAADRVRFERLDVGRVLDALDEVGAIPAVPTFASMFIGFLITVLFFVVLGAIILSFFPKRLEALRASVAAAFGQTALLGVVGLSLLFGAVPVTAMTIVGIPFVPIFLLLIIAAWTLAYALGAYTVGIQLWVGLGGDPEAGTAMRLLVFAIAIVIVALLNFIPFFGWVANYTLVLLGVGAMTRALFETLIGSPGPALDVDMKEPTSE